MSKNAIETIMGGVVLLVAGGFLAFAYQTGDVKPVSGYTVSAKFGDASGLSTGSEVRIGGIKMGVVSGLDLDSDTYQAVVHMQLKADAKVPEDSSARIVGDGLLGDKYVAIEPGGSDVMLADGGAIDVTQSSVNLETLIGKFMFSGGGVDGDKDDKDGEAKKPGQGADTSAVPSLE